jgi:CRP/FNR family cyclic AMP-dependent transcriptional regulator
MLHRFQGDGGKRIRTEALLAQKLVAGNTQLAAELSEKVQLFELDKGAELIQQGGGDNDVYFILAGAFNIVVNGRVMAMRTVHDSLGEMAAIEPTQTRSATVIAKERSVVAMVTEADFADLGTRYAEMYRCLARELAKRLIQRNAHVAGPRDRVRVFLICSVEALPIARIIESAFANEKFLPVLWTEGVFKVANYTLQSLEDQLDISDFAIAIAHSDDVTESRGNNWPSPRDNVIFELGLFMGRLGRRRAILMEPREAGIKLPSDLAGVTTISYRFEAGRDAQALMSPACNELREHIYRLGPNV